MSKKFPQILVIPIDNRPVCYDLISDTAKIFNNLKVFMPDASILGDLTKTADIEKIQGWSEHILASYPIDIAVIALDTVAYGGLISSRKTEAKFDEIKDNIDKFIQILKAKNKNIKIYAVSSIMRISDSNCNEEEKSYWDKYGKDLFRFSYLSHKLLKDYDVELEAELHHLAKTIPFEVVDDYHYTRTRNYEINSYYIDLVKKGILENIVFSEDDTAEFGFNVEEKELLQKQAIKEVIPEKVTIKTGADEMVLSLFSKALVDYFNEDINIQPVIFNEDSQNIISRYENVPIEKSVKTAIELCGGKISSDINAIKLLINAPNKVQDELCLEIYNDDENNEQADNLFYYISQNDSEFIIADIKKANGADNYLAEKLLKNAFSASCFSGFGAWNTTSNTLGSVIAIGIIKHIAQKYSKYNEDAFKKVEYIRLLDDWAYQANVRKILRQNNSTENVIEEMKPYKAKISQWLNYEVPTTYTFPWDRTFEIKINV